jgi:hypothetical protein
VSPPKDVAIWEAVRTVSVERMEAGIAIPEARMMMIPETARCLAIDVSPHGVNRSWGTQFPYPVRLAVCWWGIKYPPRFSSVSRFVEAVTHTL